MRRRKITNAQIAQEAYWDWRKEGQPSGRDAELWLRARDRLKGPKQPVPASTEHADRLALSQE